MAAQTDSGPGDAPVDGRTARRMRSRDAIVDAFLSLLREGDPSPTTEQIAKRAGVTQRTLFNHFSDVPALVEAMAARQLEHVARLMPEVPTAGPIEARVGAYLERLADALEAIAPVRWAASSLPVQLPALTLAIDHARELARQRLRALVAPDGIDLACDPELENALELACDPLTWRLMRRQQGLCREAAVAQMQRTVLSLLR